MTSLLCKPQTLSKKLLLACCYDTSAHMCSVTNVNEYLLRLLSLSLLSVELERHFELEIFSARESRSRKLFFCIARDIDSIFYVLESSFFFPFLFFLLAPNLDANQPLSLTLLHHPPTDLTHNSFQTSFNLVSHSFTFHILNLTHHPLPREILFSP